VPQVTVATLNLRKGEARWGERAPLLIEQLVALRPDIIGFQEIDLRIDQGNWICQRFGDLVDEPHSPQIDQSEPGLYMHHVANPRDRVSLEALGIMTNLPLSAHEGFDYVFRNPVAHRVRVEVAGRPLDFYNTHFHHEQDATGNEVRPEQAEKLVRWMDSHGWATPKILVGDLNSPPDTRPIHIIEEHLHSPFRTLHGREPPATIPTPLIPPDEWPADWPKGVTVDYIFVSTAVRVLDARLVFDAPDPLDAALYPSDHFGLAAVIEFD